MRRSYWFGLFIPFSAALFLMPAPSNAAVRMCNAVVSSEVVTAADEQSAKKLALDQWRAQAAKSGPGYDGWIVAAEKSLKCFKKENGTFECVAFGAPCVIQQNPNQRPVGRDRKGVGI